MGLSYAEKTRNRLLLLESWQTYRNVAEWSTLPLNACNREEVNKAQGTLPD